MALELNINLSSITYIKGVHSDKITPGSVQLTVTGDNAIRDHKVLSTSDAVINKGNITTIGFFYFKNLDNTNSVLLGSDGTTYPLKVPPGGVAIGYWNATDIHAKSSAATPDLDYFLVAN